MEVAPGSDATNFLAGKAAPGICEFPQQPLVGSPLTLKTAFCLSDPGDEDQHGLKGELWELLGMGWLGDVSRPAAGSRNAWSGRVGFRMSWQFSWVRGTVGKDIQDLTRPRTGAGKMRKGSHWRTLSSFFMAFSLSWSQICFQISWCH